MLFECEGTPPVQSWLGYSSPVMAGIFTLGCSTQLIELMYIRASDPFVPSFKTNKDATPTPVPGRVSKGSRGRRQDKARGQLEKNILSLERQLGSETFTSKAPPHIIDSMKDKLRGYRTQLEKLTETRA